MRGVHEPVAVVRAATTVLAGRANGQRQDELSTAQEGEARLLRAENERLKREIEVMRRQSQPTSLPTSQRIPAKRPRMATYAEDSEEERGIDIPPIIIPLGMDPSSFPPLPPAGGKKGRKKKGRSDGSPNTESLH